MVLAPSAASAEGFTVTSPHFKEGATLAADQVFDGFGCSGKNLSPELMWSGAPEGTQSYAVTMYDPDAPTGSGWWHWLVFNLPKTSTHLDLGAGNGKKPVLPRGAVQSVTDFGTSGYGGPCPPAGDKPHRYILKVWALKVAALPLKRESSGAMLGFYLKQNSLAEATITAKFGR